MAGTVITDKVQAASTSTLEIMNGVALTPPLIEDVNGVQVGTFCRAWVNFDGTGTVAIRDSFNVSSITDGGTGIYTVNFTNSMPDANYAVVNGVGSTNLYTQLTLGGSYGAVSITTAGYSLYGRSSATSAFQDQEFACSAVFR
jgi:hypothetical protein